MTPHSNIPQCFSDMRAPPDTHYTTLPRVAQHDVTTIKAHLFLINNTKKRRKKKPTLFSVGSKFFNLGLFFEIKQKAIHRVIIVVVHTLRTNLKRFVLGF